MKQLVKKSKHGRKLNLERIKIALAKDLAVRAIIHRTKVQCDAGNGLKFDAMLEIRESK